MTKHLETTIYCTAEINIDGDASNGRITLQLFHDSDEAYRWYQQDGADTEVSGRSVGAAKESAIAAWGSGWDLFIAPSQRGTCEECGQEVNFVTHSHSN